MFASGRAVYNGFQQWGGVERVNVTPTAAVRGGSFEFSRRWQLWAPRAVAAVPGVPGTTRLSLLTSSPAYPGTRRFGLVAGLESNVRGKAVVNDSEDEFGQAARAAAAGAAVVVLVRAPDQNPWVQWDANLLERLPIPAVVAGNDAGRPIVDRARKPGATIALTLTTVSPYLYDVMQVSRGRIPNGVVHRVNAANSQPITTRYAGDRDRDAFIAEQRFGWRPSQILDLVAETQRDAFALSVREEWVSSGDTLWQHEVSHMYPLSFAPGPLVGGITDAVGSYPRAGARTETWYSPVVRPATPLGVANTRAGDTLRLRVAAYVDPTGRHRLVADSGAYGQTSTRLYRDGVALTDLPNAWQDVPVPSGRATYRLSLATARTTDWNHSISTSTDWTFRSDGVGALPLRVDYDAPVGLDGAATRRPHRLGVTVPGARAITVEISFDDGTTWRKAACSGSSVLVPAGTAPVSLRVSASDPDGNRVRQTIVRAYGRS